LEFSDQSMAVAITPVDRSIASIAHAIATVLLQRVEAGAAATEVSRQQLLSDGLLWLLNMTDGISGVCKVLQGEIAGGIRLIETAIFARENEGLSTHADIERLNLAEVYLQILAPTEPAAFAVILKNFPTIIKILLIGPRRIRALMTRVLGNPRFDPDGHYVGRAKMILGLLYKAKKKQALALQHLTEAKRISSQFGATPMLARIDAALAELA
jgi:hypothetical protein